MIGIWRSRDAFTASWPVELYRLLGEKILKQGEPLLAFDVVRQGLQEFPRDVRLRQLQGLALARSGATERASALLEELVREKHADVETLGMLGRTFKDRAVRAASRRAARRFWRRAAATYAQAHAGRGDYWTGINAATTALLSGETRRALALAKKVRAACLRELRRRPGDRYWLLATLGEAALIEHDWRQANDWYAEAAQVAGRRFGDLQASRRNARLLLDFWQADGSEVEKSLAIPPVAVFAGHMVDRADRAALRFPERFVPSVADLIKARIEKIRPAVGYASAACGSDILFLEAMLSAGHEIAVVLPCPPEQFAAESVMDGTPEQWPARFERILQKATRLVVASHGKPALEGVSYDYTNQLILGLARIRAAQLDSKVVPIAVWDQGPGDGAGGTASAIGRWRKLGLAIEMIDLSRVISSPNEQRSGRARAATIRLTSDRNRPREAAVAPEIRAILFADAVGFSRVTETQLPIFVKQFLGLISRRIARAEGDIITRNTWGDGLYLVFRNVATAGRFALRLAESISRIDWARRGLPTGLGLRMGVHAGPVYRCLNPIKQTREFFGTHVNRAARMEPITPPGQVYASEAFVALAAAQEVTELAFEYAGQVPMAKGYGIYPTYHLRWADNDPGVGRSTVKTASGARRSKS